MRYCIYCGMPMEDDDKYCTRCGRAVEEEPASRDPEAEGSRANGKMAPPPPMPERQYTSPQKPQNTQNNQNRYGSGTDHNSGIDIGRLIIYATAGVLVAVLGFALFTKLKPGPDHSADPGNNTYASYDQGTDSGESNGQGQQTFSSGNNTPAASGAGGNTEVTIHSGQDQGAAVTSEDDDYQTGWVTNDEGDVTYYPEEDEEYTGYDQTGREEEEEEEEEESVTIQSEPEENELTGQTMAGDDSYILSDSSSRYYSKEELNKLSDYDLQMAINEIYARHGRKFDTKSIREYFEGKSWYRGTISPADFDKNESSYFNQYEKANKDLMAKIRAEREKASGKTMKWE